MSTANRFVSDSDTHRHPLRRMLLPSWSSSLLGLCVFLAIVAAAFFMAQIHHNSDLNHSVIDQTNGAVSAFRSSYHQYGERYTHNQLVSNIGVIAFWAAVGLLILSFAVNVIQGLKEAATLTYEHVNRFAVIRNALERLFVRILAAGLLIAYVAWIARAGLPALAGALSLATGNSSAVQKVLYCGIIVAAGWLGWQLLTILLRLIVLRSRLFYTPDESL